MIAQPVPLEELLATLTALGGGIVLVARPMPGRSTEGNHDF